ncbi:MAG: hypothetical protein GH145_00325 [Firmicutes bacterium]|nr:hypothetical protein [Bacillota bacterium]
MKKSTVLCTIILVLGISLAAHAAGAQKVTFEPVEQGLDDSSSGFVVINKTPTGAIEATIEIQIRNAASECVYEVWSEDNCLDTFTTNKKGHGHVHINLSSEGDLAAYISIWTEDKTSQILIASIPKETEGTEEQEETQEQEEIEEHEQTEDQEEHEQTQEHEEHEQP